MSLNDLTSLVTHFKNTSQWEYTFGTIHHIVFRHPRTQHFYTMHMPDPPTPINVGNLAMPLLDIRPNRVTTSLSLQRFGNNDMATLRGQILYRPHYMQLTCCLQINNSQEQVVAEERVLTYSHILVAMDVFAQSFIQHYAQHASREDL